MTTFKTPDTEEEEYDPNDYDQHPGSLVKEFLHKQEEERKKEKEKRLKMEEREWKMEISMKTKDLRTVMESCKPFIGDVRLTTPKPTVVQMNFTEHECTAFAVDSDNNKLTKVVVPSSGEPGLDVTIYLPYVKVPIKPPTVKLIILNDPVYKTNSKVILDFAEYEPRLTVNQKFR